MEYLLKTSDCKLLLFIFRPRTSSCRRRQPQLKTPSRILCCFRGGSIVRTTIDRYKKACADASNPGSVAEANTQLTI
ncbi:Uncharacterized protein TCM_017200 [Theobroma cacao]|uniref:Uncharacterized protein n=1 Tax=Theobroma cacao TaxID=3641 RepID=A0A061EEH7_THECC|nr:Uncharacterized protein TCM_017200 [Theobroma cacao]